MGLLATHLLLALVPAAARHVPDDPWAAARGPQVAELVPRLEELAGWAGEEKLFHAREAVYRMLVHFEPDHPAARRGLGYRKSGSEWEPPRRPKATKDFQPELLPEFEERRRAAVAPFVEAAFAFLAGRGEAVPRAVREEVHDEVLVLEPSQPEIRALRDEVEVDGQWLLRESAAVPGRLELLRAAFAAGLDEAPEPERVEPDAREAALGVDWTYCLATPLFRVLGTGDVAEGLECARRLHAAWRLFNEAFGTRVRLGFSTTFFLLAEPSQRVALLDHHPGVTPENRGYLASVEGGVIPGTSDFVHAARGTPRRLDAAVRFGVGRMVLDGFGLGSDLGWVSESLGMYFTHAAVGTRTTWYLSPGVGWTSADSGLFQRLSGARVDWLAEAQRLDEQGRLPPLPEAFGVPLAELTPSRMLVGYVLCAYLIEGTPDRAPEFLRRIGRRREPEAQALEAVFGRPVEEMDARLRRWLRERAALTSGS